LEWTEDTNDAFERARDTKLSVISPQPYAQKLFPFCLSSVVRGLKVDKFYRGADKSLARPTSRCVLFGGENISFDACLVLYMYSTDISPIMIINRIYETQNLLSL